MVFPIVVERDLLPAAGWQNRGGPAQSNVYSYREVNRVQIRAERPDGIGHIVQFY